MGIKFGHSEGLLSVNAIKSLTGYLAIILLSAMQIGATSVPREVQIVRPEEKLEATTISIVAILANPDKFDGKILSTAGYLTLDHEGTALYLDKESSIASIHSNAIWIEFQRRFSPDERQELGERYVTVTGILRANKHGYGNSFSGTLEITILPRAIRTSDDYRAYLDREKISAWRQWTPMAATILVLLALCLFLIRRRMLRR